jgi:hypothetical protein
VRSTNRNISSAQARNTAAGGDIALTQELVEKFRPTSPCDKARRLSLQKNANLGRFVTGHDFSRADKANHINGL